jgi:hypothetical protein
LTDVEVLFECHIWFLSRVVAAIGPITIRRHRDSRCAPVPTEPDIDLTGRNWLVHVARSVTDLVLGNALLLEFRPERIANERRLGRSFTGKSLQPRRRREFPITADWILE